MAGRVQRATWATDQRTKDVGGWVRVEPSQSPKYRLVMRISLPEGPHPPSPSFNLDNPTFANWTEGLYKLNRVSWELVIRLSNFVDDILKTYFVWWPFPWWSLWPSLFEETKWYFGRWWCRLCEVVRALGWYPRYQDRHQQHKVVHYTWYLVISDEKEPLNI